MDPEEKNSVHYESEIICEGYEFVYRCPRSFESLEWMVDPETKTLGGKVGFCNECNRKVHLCETNDEIARQVSRGNCVAIMRPSEKPLVRIGNIGVMMHIPAATEITIELQRDVFKRIDESLLKHLRDEGFVGSHSDLRKQHEGYEEIISIELDVTQNSKFKISYCCLFSELVKLEFRDSFFIHSKDYLVSNEASNDEKIDLDATVDRAVVDVAATRNWLNPIWHDFVS